MHGRLSPQSVKRHTQPYPTQELEKRAGTISVEENKKTRVAPDDLGRFTPLPKDKSIAAGLKPLAVGWRTAQATDTTAIIMEKLLQRMHTRPLMEWSSIVLEDRVRTINDACPNDAYPRTDLH